MTLSQPKFQVIPSSEYTPLIGSMVAMMEHCRESVLDSVAGLSVEALEHQHDQHANPIGALLAHMAAVEWYYQIASIGGSQPSGGDWLEWGAYLRLTPATWAAAKGYTLEQHVERLASVRARTLAGLSTKDDAWLQQTFALPWTPEQANNHWAWYHIIEDELNHRGQIRWLKSRLPDSFNIAPASGS